MTCFLHWTQSFRTWNLYEGGPGRAWKSIESEKKKNNSQRLWLIQRKNTLAGRNITRYCRVISGMKPPGYPSEEVLQVCLWRVSVSLCLCLCVSVSMPVHLGVFVRGSLFAIIRSSSKLIFSCPLPTPTASNHATWGAVNQMSRCQRARAWSRRKINCGVFLAWKLGSTAPSIPNFWHCSSNL